uniref:ABC transporter permease n=1 Tax=Eiseniibacteriota bacterium TaxID=2212470 RepID=A0A832I1M2_UNCEI
MGLRVPARELFALAAESLAGHRLRTSLTLVATAIGVTAVVLLTALGDAARRYVTEQFASVGTNLVIVLPGKTETSGIMGSFGGTVRPLTLDDAEALPHRAPLVRGVVPLSLGSASFEYGNRSRDVYVLGTTWAYAPMRDLAVTSGQFLPRMDMRRGERVAVIGRKLQREVFQGENPLGKPVRIAGARFRVIGVLAPKGMGMGVDLDDMALIPVATGLRLFNQKGLFRMVCQAPDAASVPAVVKQVREVMMQRHDGDEDFSILTQDSMLQTFTSIINALTAGLAGIAAISLAVAGILIMNVMLVSVSERTGEVGLLKALGARRAQILSMFLAESLLLSAQGALLGVVTGVVIVYAAAGVFPELPLAPSPGWIAFVTALALAAGVSFGLLPARRAAGLAAAEALRASR